MVDKKNRKVQSGQRLTFPGPGVSCTKEMQPLPPGSKDGVTVVVGAKFNTADRLRILLEGSPEFRITLATENEIGRHNPFQTSLIIR